MNPPLKKIRIFYNYNLLYYYSILYNYKKYVSFLKGDSWIKIFKYIYIHQFFINFGGVTSNFNTIIIFQNFDGE